MDAIYWNTQEPHYNNTETMTDYLDNYNMLDIDYIDGSYAEGVNAKGEKYGIHAFGNGDSYHHVVTFELLNE